MATTTGTIDRIFGALNEGSTAVVDRLQSANERMYRLSKAVLEEVQENRQGALELGKKIVKDPTDLLGVTTVAFERANIMQGRALRLTRLSIEELLAAGRENRETAQRVTTAGREAGQALAEATRDVATRSAQAFQAAFTAGVSEARTKVDGVRAKRTATQAQEAA